MFEAFYAQYVATCAAHAVAPLGRSDLQALIELLLEHAVATVQ
jgi:hypothetical protein